MVKSRESKIESEIFRLKRIQLDEQLMFDISIILSKNSIWFNCDESNSFMKIDRRRVNNLTIFLLPLRRFIFATRFGESHFHCATENWPSQIWRGWRLFPIESHCLKMSSKARQLARLVDWTTGRRRCCWNFDVVRTTIQNCQFSNTQTQTSNPTHR